MAAEAPVMRPTGRVVSSAHRFARVRDSSANPSRFEAINDCAARQATWAEISGRVGRQDADRQDMSEEAVGIRDESPVGIDRFACGQDGLRHDIVG